MNWPFWPRRDRDRELTEEIGAHLKMAILDRVRRGESLADATAAVRREFGNLASVKETTRSAWSWAWVEPMVQDFRRAARSLVAHRAFSAIAIGSLALAVCTSAGVFTVLDATSGRGLPFGDAERLVHLYTRNARDQNNPLFQLSSQAFRAVAEANSQLAAVAPYRGARRIVREEGWATGLSVVEVTSAFTSILGARVIAGRTFTPDDERSGAPRVAILSYGLWASRFGGDREAVGRSVDVDGRPLTIVGVMSRETEFPDRTQLWIVRPLQDFLTDTAQYSPSIIARLKPGVTLGDVNAELAVIGARQDRPGGPALKSAPIAAMPFRKYLAVNVRGLVRVLMMLGAVIGIIAAVNFATLVLARGLERREELGIRSALGASPSRLVWNVLAECLLVSIAGGALGALGAPLLVRSLMAILGAAIPPWMHVTWGATTALAAIVLAVATGVTFGLAPAVELARPAAAGFLRGGAGAAAGTKRQRRGRRALVALQVALATGPIVFIGAVAGHVLTIRVPSTGIDEQNLLTGVIQSVAPDGGDTTWRSPTSTAALLDAIRAVPGVAAAGVSRSFSLNRYDVTVEGSSAGEASRSADDPFSSVFWQLVTPQLFSTLRLGLVTGRFPSTEEYARGDPVAVVTAHSAQLLAGAVSTGWRVRLKLSKSASTTLTVVGVVKDFKQTAIQTSPRTLIQSPYMPSGRLESSWESVWIRASEAPERLIPAVYASVKTAGANLALLDLALKRDVSRREARQYLSVAIIAFGIFGIAVILAALGIYGMIAYAVVMRGKEVAVRLALGASKAHLAFLVLREAAVQTGIGLGFGVLGGILAAIRFTDGQTVLRAPPVGTTMLAVVALAATLVVAAVGPVRRVWRTDLAGALRAE